MIPPITVSTVPSVFDVVVERWWRMCRGGELYGVGEEGGVYIDLDIDIDVDINRDIDRQVDR